MKYADLSREHRKLEKLPYDPHHEAKNTVYWKANNSFKELLRLGLRNEELLRKMTRPQLFQFIAWCSSFRPHEPHVILTSLSRLVD